MTLKKRNNVIRDRNNVRQETKFKPPTIKNDA
jgi:hypothetical protein